MFEQASRLKLRFQTPIGVLSHEDLWDLPLTRATGDTNLNDIAKDLRREVKEAEEEDFVAPKTKENKLVNLRFDIVKHIINVRLAEREESVAEVAKKHKREQILEVLAQKEAEELAAKSPDELRAMLDD